ncbi:MAG: acyl-CoA dehydrogenase, partial [Chloroflexi bacterium]
MCARPVPLAGGINMSNYAFLAGVPQWAALLGVVLVVSTLGYSGAALWLWTVAAALALLGWGAPAWLWGVAAALAVLFNVPALRTVLLSRPVMRLLRTLQLLPVISETERIAIEA